MQQTSAFTSYIGLLLPNSISSIPNSTKVVFPLYDHNSDCAFITQVKAEKAAMENIPKNEPALLNVLGLLTRERIMQDALGPVLPTCFHLEALQVNDIKCVPLIPTILKEATRTKMGPINFTPGPKNGYWIVNLEEGAEQNTDLQVEQKDMEEEEEEEEKEQEFMEDTLDSPLEEYPEYQTSPISLISANNAEDNPTPSPSYSARPSTPAVTSPQASVVISARELLTAAARRLAVPRTAKAAAFTAITQVVQEEAETSSSDVNSSDNSTIALPQKRALRDDTGIHKKMKEKE